MSNPAHPTRVLLTAGPTHESIDSVRYLANRSSGALGMALAQEASTLGLETRLLLGPIPLPQDPLPECVQTHRFTSTADLEALLAHHAPWADLIIMAAAVADFRPAANPTSKPTKLRRSQSGFSLDLEPTPDLIAQIASKRRPGQIIVGFALEPADRLQTSALDKLERKSLDFIVANPLETMDSPQIEATLFARGTSCAQPPVAIKTPGKVSKDAFARWLFGQLFQAIGPPNLDARRNTGP